jgi:hypothetical protein
MEDALGAFLSMLGLFGGISLLVWTSTRAKIERIKAERQVSQSAPPDAVLAELKILTQKIAEVQSTSHQFDLSFDAALDRLESRVGRLETQTVAQSTPTNDVSQQRIGQR